MSSAPRFLNSPPEARMYVLEQLAELHGLDVAIQAGRITLSSRETGEEITADWPPHRWPTFIHQVHDRFRRDRIGTAVRPSGR